MLTEENKIFINEKIESGLNDYVVIANLLFKKEKLTGRSKQAKMVRDYLVEAGMLEKKKRQNFSPVKEKLTDNQKEFISSMKSKIISMCRKYPIYNEAF